MNPKGSRVTAMCAFWDEPPELLTAAVESLAGFCDRLVVFDGAYELVPDATLTSPPEQARAIRAAAKVAGVKLTMREPSELWSGQVEKRNEMLQLAADPKLADWVMPLDADWILSGNKPPALKQLAVTRADAMVCHFYTPVDPDRPVSETAANEWHVHTIGVQNIPLVFRVLERMEIKMRHWWYAGYRGSTRIALWGDPGGVPATTEPLVGLQIEHRTHFRPTHTIVRNREFCRRRDLQVAYTGLEA